MPKYWKGILELAGSVALLLALGYGASWAFMADFTWQQVGLLVIGAFGLHIFLAVGNSLDLKRYLSTFGWIPMVIGGTARIFGIFISAMFLGAGFVVPAMRATNFSHPAFDTILYLMCVGITVSAIVVLVIYSTFGSRYQVRSGSMVWDSKLGVIHLEGELIYCRPWDQLVGVTPVVLPLAFERNENFTVSFSDVRRKVRVRYIGQILTENLVLPSRHTSFRFEELVSAMLDKGRASLTAAASRMTYGQALEASAEERGFAQKFPFKVKVQVFET